MAEEVEKLDRNIRNAFKSGTEILTVQWLGVTVWSTSARVMCRNAEGAERSYFLKINPPVDNGRAVAEGEILSSRELYSVVGKGTPRPVEWGALESDPRSFFILYYYRELYNELPPVKEVVKLLSHLHRCSESPDGLFGFPVDTYRVMVRSRTSRRSKKWETFFTDLLNDTMLQDREIHGADEELVGLEQAVLSKVVPRLLRPLETGGREVKPVLLHGNLWHGNMATDEAYSDIPAVFFDPACFYGHNEYDLAFWRAGRYKTNLIFRQEYVREMGESAPGKDFDDRNALYALRVDLMLSCARPHGNRIRKQAIEEMRRLVEKYRGGYEEYLERYANGELPSPRMGTVQPNRPSSSGLDAMI